MAFIPVSLVSFLLYAAEPLVPHDSGEDEVIGNVQVFPFFEIALWLAVPLVLWLLPSVQPTPAGLLKPSPPFTFNSPMLYCPPWKL